MGEQHARFARRQPRRREHGFTLLELLVTIAVAAVLLGIAIPSYRGVVQRNAMAATVNDLVGDLQYARSQAVTRGQPVHLCKSADNATCAIKGSWSQGWLVYTPDPGSATSTPAGNRLRVHGALDGQVAINGTNNTAAEVVFDANGFTTDFGSFTATADTATRNTRIVISRSGRIRTEDAAKDE